MNPVYVYRLLVDLPDDVSEANPPQAWLDEHEAPGYYTDDPPRFSWPTRRNYLSLGGARAAADRLISYGADVNIVRSLQVRIPDEPCATPETAGYCDVCATGDHFDHTDDTDDPGYYCLCPCWLVRDAA